MWRVYFIDNTTEYYMRPWTMNPWLVRRVTRIDTTTLKGLKQAERMHNEH